ncbi:MAG TPA: type II secretion system protein GspM [Wenzhouxiangellaceae bacterium]|nr:type II secretion system protein GspM [Wenzhouxiangellaceae bacterium]
MKLMPDPQQSRPLAIGLLAVAVMLVYFVGFHWFVMRHVSLSGEIGDLERQIARYKGTVEMAEPMRARLNELRASQMDSALFLDGSDANIATAELIRMLRDWVDRSAADAELCNITNTSPRRYTDPERFRSVRVNVRMQCPLDDFMRVLYEMESGVPLVFIDNIMINQRLTPDQRNRRGTTPYGQLDIRFEMYGYINQPGAGEEP